jgi:hypothetical protein
MTLDASGNLLVGTTTPVYNASGRGLITINGSSAAAVGFTAGGADKGIILHTGTDMIMSNSVAGAITFQTTNTERARIPAAGGFQSKTTISVGDATPSLSGAGITFPASQSASSDANTLDDYEEGTWTPTDASGAGLSITFNNARYTKIGRLVYVSVSTIEYPTTASAVSAVIGGLPFANLSGDVASNALVASNAFANRSLVITNATTVYFYADATTGASTNVQLSGATIYGWSAVYQTS